MLSGVASSDALLSSYQEERLEHVREITLRCIKLGEVVCETDPFKAKAIHSELRRNRTLVITLPIADASSRPL